MDSIENTYPSSQSGPNRTLPVPIANANVTRKRKTTTCDHCKRKHVKCEPVHLSPGPCPGAGTESCRQCQKDQVACTQTRTAIRFSDVSSKIAKLNHTGGSVPDTRPRAKQHKKLVYVDETAELTALYKHDEDNETYDMCSDHGSIGREYEGRPNNRASTPTDETVPMDANLNIQAGDIRSNSALTSSYAPSGVLPGSFVLRGLVKPPDSAHSRRYNTLEFCLLEYYIDHLSMWLDLCDPERHFHQVVPQRARSCPPLMNAILAASARHLTRVPKYRTESGAVKYGGRTLHDLTDETALHYHSKCIQDLLELGANPEQTGNEDLLAAAIILRFYEEIDYPLQDEQKDDEVFLRVLNMFIEAQIPNMAVGSQALSTVAGEISTSPGEIYSSPSSNVFGNTTSLESRWYMSSLRQAAFWVAFRQEVYSAFLKQRPFSMSLSRCDIFRSFTPGEDGLWTARLVIFCADILEFCYGNTAHSTAQATQTQTQPHPHPHPHPQPKERWAQLKCLSQKWIDSLPCSFEPIYVREPDRRQGEVFPEICYLTNIHVAGVQHIELARILLAVYDPDIPRLGLGHKESMRALSEELRAAVLRLCGIAVCNRQNPPSLTTALLGIVVCGEHFEDRVEQMALMELLDELDYHHGWPVGYYRERLKQSWGWP